MNSHNNQAQSVPASRVHDKMNDSKVTQLHTINTAAKKWPNSK